MSIPMPANTTCDIYRTGNSPPAAPDVAAVKCYLQASKRNSFNTKYHTHVLYVDAATDIRDGYNAAVPDIGAGPTADSVYIPDRNSNVQYIVAEVRRVGRGTAIDHKRVYLLRKSVTYPSNDL